MSLSAYNKKRSFTKTNEPKGGKSTGKELRFVIQKHAATHLHYDFRLEMDGVLKSWAVPKGPSTDPKIKRLAMMVEDHPYDYKDFEGIIPQGEYGGGTVMVWDEGTYIALEAKEQTINQQENYLLKELKKGSVKLILKGKKLNGEFALIKTKGMGENAWLLIKHNDKYASETDITKKDKSVKSNKTLKQIEQAFNDKSPITKKEDSKKKSITKNTVVEDREDLAPKISAIKNILKTATKQKFYTKVKPMLATLVDHPVEGDDWLYEIKWDGYRAVAMLNKNNIELKSRNDKSFNEKFYPIFNALKEVGTNAILDGEIVVVNEKGMANFGALQNWKSEADGELRYYVFDILWYEGYNLKELPLTARKTILEKIMPNHHLFYLSEPIQATATDFLATAKDMGLEGIMAKRKDSLYEANRRGENWLKIKANQSQEVVIGGYTINENTNKPFSALLVGVFNNKQFIYIGKVGTGFSIKTQKEMIDLFKPLQIENSAFKMEPNVNKGSRFRPNPPNAKEVWLKPQLICEVNFTEITSDGLMRHPAFKGLRTDKKVNEVSLELPKQLNKATVIDDLAKHIKPIIENSTGFILNPHEQTQVKKINGHELKFTNLSKMFWPEDKITKRDLINYYDQVAPYLLPYLKNRPQSLNRYPNGINGKSFYQKDVTDKVPDWAKTYLYHSKDSEADKHFLLANDEATLLYMANLGSIEINPWSSTIKKPDHPTWCIIDLDPDQNSFNEVIEAAQITKQILEDMGIDSYCKTSGSTGLHIYIPFGNKYTYEQSKEFARIIVTLVHKELPKITSLERAIKDRDGKMYLDFLQNRAQATVAAPYAVRPKPGATVSIPLHWDEVKKGLKMTDFTIFNTLERLNSVGDIFKPVLGKGIDLRKVIKQASLKSIDDK